METKKLTAKDLMIGDWVLCVDSTHKNKTYAKIDAIEEGQRCILVRDGNRNWFLDIDDLQPIPLTAEILEKNGFVLYKQDFTSCKVYKFGDYSYIECNDDHEDSRYNYFIIGVYTEYKRFGFLKKYIHGVMKIYYVHELQHVLRPCGIEKEITI